MTGEFAASFALLAAAVALVDACWALYLRAVQRGRAAAAALWAALTALLTTHNVTEYVKDGRLKWAVVLGAFIGTAAAVRLARSRPPAAKDGGNGAG